MSSAPAPQPTEPLPPAGTAAASGLVQGMPRRAAPWTASSRAPGTLRLKREAELPALLSSMDAAQQLSAQEPAEIEYDGQRPAELASRREEHRQITAISRIVCQAAAEALVGLRPVHQMQRWLDAEVYAKIQLRCGLAAAQRLRTGSETVQRVRPTPLQFRSVRAQQAAAAAWEVSVVFTDERRTHACAMRLAAHRGRWRVTAMELG